MKQRSINSKLTLCLLPCLLIFLCGVSSCFLPGTIKGIVKDAVTNLPVEGAAITLIKNSITINQAQTDSSGAYSLEADAESGYAITVEMTDYLTVTYKNIGITDNETTYLETILQLADAYTGSGTVSGTITNAFTGEGVPGAEISLRKGINTISGAVITTATALSDGSFSVTCNGGNYTGEIIKDEYTKAYFTLTCIGGQTNPNQNGTITPTIGDAQTRIILTWGAAPPDLDSHLTGPLDAGEKFHVYYSQPESLDGNADLDLDDRVSYGPETTTIYSQLSGTYRFSVHDYSNKYAESSTALSISGAQVKVYKGSTLADTFNVPNHTGTLWTVFEMNGSTITPVNSMTNEYNEEAITRVAKQDSTPFDTNLISDLPEKE